MRDLPQSAFGDLRYEPTGRRVRADDALDSTRALLVWEPRRIVPSYAVPEEDVRAAVEPGPTTTGRCPASCTRVSPSRCTPRPGTPVSVGGRLGAGFRLDDLPGHVVLDFAAFDAWYEEDERVRGHPRDPFTRIDVRRTSRPVRIEVDGEVLAETVRARLLFETGIHTRFYLPREDVHGELVPSERRSYCPYKGEASYFSLGRHTDIAWSYEHPLPDGPLVDGLVAFFDERVEVVARRGAPRAATAPMADVMREQLGA